MKKASFSILSALLAAMLLAACTQVAPSSQSIAESETPVPSEVVSNSVVASVVAVPSLRPQSNDSVPEIVPSPNTIAPTFEVEGTADGYRLVLEDGTTYTVDFNFPEGIYYSHSNLY